MSTFARLVGGSALDCQVAATVAELAARFHPDWLARNPFTQVPEGTLHGARDNGDGTFTNPVVPLPVLTPASISASEFQETCEAAFGGGMIGATRFGQVMRDMGSSADDLVFSVYQKFVKSSTFDRPKTAAALQVLVAKNIMVANERTAVIAAWRMV